ncbi:type II secretion system GspH family protein [bacterium]|nr:type II secretion system GspH family protein [bacterium]
MSSHDRHQRKGFTLVELVVVILILGIIATVAVPRVVRSTSNAAESAIKQDLASVRSAVELYASDHGGVFPGSASGGTGFTAGTEAAFKGQVLNYTNALGEVSTTKSTAYPFGPYLRKPFPKAPAGPRSGVDTIKMETAGTLLTGADESTAWRYDSTTGEFIMNSDDFASDGVTKYDQY